MTKSEFRKIYLAKQKSLSKTEREKKSLQIATRFFENFDLTRIEFLHLFLPIEKTTKSKRLLFLNAFGRISPK